MSWHEFSSITTLAESGNTCLISSSTKWVIASGATDHMTCNPDIFSQFSSHTVSSSITIADGTTYTIAGSVEVHTTSSITLSSVLYLPNLAFNLFLSVNLPEILIVVSPSIRIIVFFKIL